MCVSHPLKAVGKLSGIGLLGSVLGGGHKGAALLSPAYALLGGKKKKPQAQMDEQPYGMGG